MPARSLPQTSCSRRSARRRPDTQAPQGSAGGAWQKTSATPTSVRSIRPDLEPAFPSRWGHYARRVSGGRLHWRETEHYSVQCMRRVGTRNRADQKADGSRDTSARFGVRRTKSTEALMRAIAWSDFPASNAPITAYRNSMIESSAARKGSTDSEGIMTAKSPAPRRLRCPYLTVSPGISSSIIAVEKRAKRLRGTRLPAATGLR